MVGWEEGSGAVEPRMELVGKMAMQERRDDWAIGRDARRGASGRDLFKGGGDGDALRDDLSQHRL